MYLDLYNGNQISFFGILILSWLLLFNPAADFHQICHKLSVGLIKSHQTYKVNGFTAIEMKNSCTLEDIASSAVPPVYLSKLPQDFHQIMTLEERKNVFIKCLLPLILKVNQDISRERTKLINLKKQVDANKILSFKDKAWLTQLRNKYRLQQVDLNQLLIRVDIIPPSLALAQAIEETGWGSSYAARLKHSTFGITLSTGVKRYNSLLENVEGYMLNLNANPAYKRMREIRYGLRKNNLDLCSLKLVGGLSKYSELRSMYLDKLSVHIRKNDLRNLDQSILST